jgi:hypothetical protein
LNLGIDILIKHPLCEVKPYQKRIGKPEKKHEAMVCDAWRAAITKRYGVWRRLLSAEIPTATDMRPLHRECWSRLSSDGQVSDGRLTLPKGDTPFDREVATTALEMVETRLYGEIRNGYDRARRDEYLEKMTGLPLLDFSNVNFANFSFLRSHAPKIKRIKIKVKKFVYYKLIFKIEKAGARGTILAFDQKVRFASMAK